MANSVQRRQQDPRQRGGDFSHYQTGALFQSAIKGMKWAALKATEGTTYTDPTFHARWKELGQKVHSGQMKLRMAYGFLTPGNGKAQADHFLKTVGVHGKLPAGTRLALDWESSALSHPQVLRDAANHIHQVTGQWPVVYCSDSQVARARHVVPHAPVWDAKWSGPAPKGAQFVQTNDGPGYDHDYFKGTAADLAKLAGFQPADPHGLTAADQHGNQVIASALKDGPVHQSGDAAQAMKRMLVLAGLDAGAGKAFNAQAVKALEQFQSARGLQATGELDGKTFADLKTVEQHVRQDPKTFITGQKSAATTRAERQLSQLGYATGPHDGVWDRKDAAALHAFKVDAQDKDRTGALGTTVEAQLTSEVQAQQHHPYRVRRQNTASHQRLDALTLKEATRERTGAPAGIQVGDQGRAVAVVKAHLAAAGFDPRHPGTGFDGQTEAAVKAFQRESKLPVTGRVDGKTWAALKKTYIYNPKAPLAEWEKSGQVKTLEGDLRKLGATKLNADGLFDGATVKAVKQFEAAHGLPVDGVVTARELQRIDAAAHRVSGKVPFQIAHSLLGRNVESLKTHGPLKGLLDTWVSSHVCCANFVSACYQKAGIFTKSMHQDGVLNLAAELRKDHRFQAISLAHAQPGDIVCFKTGGAPGEEHTEMFAGWDHGQPTFIGSNNINADGSQRISISHTRYPLIGVFHYRG